MKFKLLISVILVCTGGILTAQCGLQSGPMPGHSDMLEVVIWAQTKCEQKIQIRYWEEGTSDRIRYTAPVHTSRHHGYCAHLVADQVEPGKKYQYAILIDDAQVELPQPVFFRTQTLWQWRTDPPDFRFVAGSCSYVNEPVYDRPGKPYGGGYEIFSSIRDEKPDMMIWLGDNIYLREVDWNSRTGIYHRYTHSRSNPELGALLSSTHHFATWDDHDFGPNDSDRSYWGKDITLQAFKDFWANPNYGVGGTEGITGTFFWEDCQFFIMDDRWYRGPQPEGDYYGETQLTWLIEALRFSRASFKFVCTGGQILSNAAVYENYAVFANERKALIDSLDKYNISGVIFLTGDRHHSEVSTLSTPDGDVFYDITSSALTSSTTAHPDEPNSNRVPDSMIGERNYAVIEVTGPLKARVCNLTFKNTFGETLKAYSINNIRKK